MNILAIESKRRAKHIFLRETIIPVNGGKENYELVFGKNGVNFQKLLFKIQNEGKSLLQIHKSWAVIIYHYTMNESKSFLIKDNLKRNAPENILRIPIDSQFQKHIYQKQLFKMTRLKKWLLNACAEQENGNEIMPRIKEIGLADE